MKRDISGLIGYFDKIIEFNKDVFRGAYRHSDVLIKGWTDEEIQDAKIKALANKIKKEIEKNKDDFRNHGLRIKSKRLMRLGWIDKEIDKAIKLAKPASLLGPLVFVILLVIIGLFAVLHNKGLI